MKISYNWLKEYLDIEIGPEEVAEKLTLTGLEVEGLEKIGGELPGVVVGKVLTCVNHPNADRLKLCEVDIGEKTVQIVCGAPNVAAEQTVPVATVGTTLPLKNEKGEYLVLRKAKIRGEVSEGMICAEDELGLSDNHEGIMVLNEKLKPGTSFSKALDLETDYVFEIGLTPNRPDASSHIGVARDLAAVTGKKLKKPVVHPPSGKKDMSKWIEIEIKDPDKCPRYTGRLIRNVKVAESPGWLKKRLTAIGVRPVNNVVDATNFVLHEMGQPLHSFDYDRIESKKIIVQSFDKTIRFDTLDHVNRKVPAGSLFICDADKPVAIAGIMGGLNSEIDSNTQNVFLESAYFEPTGIRSTSKQLALQTDASYRFERGIDPAMSSDAAERCTRLISELTGGEIVEGELDIYPKKIKEREIPFRLSYMNRLLGTEFNFKLTSGILKKLEIEIINREGDQLLCRVPTFRPDIEREVDLVEEVARIYDYNRIPAPEFVRYITPAPIPGHELFIDTVKDIVKRLNYREIHTNSLLPEEAAEKLGFSGKLIRALNPISADQSVMRPSLLYGLMRSAAYNFNRSADGIRFFEIGHVFRAENPGTWIEGIREELDLIIGVSGYKLREHWQGDKETYTFFDVKGTINALLDTLRLDHHIKVKYQNKQQLGYYIGKEKIGMLSRVGDDLKKYFDMEQDVFAAQFSLSLLEKHIVSDEERRYTEIPKYPSIEYDIALIVDESILAGELNDAIKKTAGSILKTLEIFDVYEGKSVGDGKKSIAFRLTFLDNTKTLTISAIEPIIKNILQVLENKFSARLRD